MTNLIELNTDKKAQIIDSYQKKGNWRLFAKTSQIVNFPKKAPARAIDSQPATSRQLGRDYSGLIDSAYLREKTMIGSNGYFELTASIKLDSHSFNKMKKAETQARPRATKLHDWIGRCVIDLNNYFYRQFDLPCHSPSVKLDIRSKNGVKTIVFRWGFDIENRSDYRQTRENIAKMQDIALNIRQNGINRAG